MEPDLHLVDIGPTLDAICIAATGIAQQLHTLSAQLQAEHGSQETVTSVKTEPHGYAAGN